MTQWEVRRAANWPQEQAKASENVIARTRDARKAEMKETKGSRRGK